MADMAQELVKQDIGITLDNITVPGLFFADDICIIAPRKKIHKTMEILEYYSRLDEIEFSGSKSMALAINFVPKPNETIHLGKIPDGERWDEVNIPFTDVGKYLGVLFKTKNSMYGAQWESISARISGTSKMLGVAIRNVVNPTILGELLWDVYGLPAFAYAWETIHLTKTQLETLDKSHRQYAKLALQVQHNAKTELIYKMHMGWKPSIYYEKVKHNFWQFIKQADNGRWVRAALREMQSWPDCRNSWWKDMKEILDKRGINYNTHWSKAEFRHYWNMVLRRETDSQETVIHQTIRRYNRILHKWWMKWLVGDLRLFGEVWRDVKKCPLCNAEFSWDHLILYCPEVYGVYEIRTDLRNSLLSETELTLLSNLIHK